MVRDYARLAFNDSIYDVFDWARAHRATHKDGAFARNRDEPRTLEGTTRWRDRLFDSIKESSFATNITRRNKWDAFLRLARCPAVPADMVDGNQAHLERNMGDADPEQIILAFAEYVIEPQERNKARNDLNNAAIRQNTSKMEVFIPHRFDPAAKIARLEDTNYAECLLNAANDNIHKKMAAKHYQPLQSRLRSLYGPDRWSITPNNARRMAMHEDNNLRTIAQDKPLWLDDYLISEEKAAAVSEEAIVYQKVAAIRNETAAVVDELRKEHDARLATLEKEVVEVKSEVKQVSTDVQAVNATVAGMLKLMQDSNEKQDKHAADISAKLDAIANRGNGGGGGGGSGNRFYGRLDGYRSSQQTNQRTSGATTATSLGTEKSTAARRRERRQKLTSRSSDPEAATVTMAAGSHSSTLQDPGAQSKQSGSRSKLGEPPGLSDKPSEQRHPDGDPAQDIANKSSEAEAQQQSTRRHSDIAAVCDMATALTSMLTSDSMTIKQQSTFKAAGQAPPGPAASLAIMDRHIGQSTARATAVSTGSKRTTCSIGTSTREHKGTITVTPSVMFEMSCQEPQLDLMQHAIDLQHLRLSVESGTNPDELWVDLIHAAERIAQSVECPVTDMLEAGELKIKWRMPHLYHFPNGHTRVTADRKGWNTISCMQMDYTTSPLAIHCSPSVAWESQARAHESQVDIISSAYPSIEKAIQAMEIMFAQRSAAHDPAMAADPASIRSLLVQRIASVCESIAGHLSTDPSGKTAIAVSSVVDRMGDALSCAFSLRKLSRQQLASNDTEAGAEPGSIPTGLSAAPAAAVSSAQRRRQQRQAMQAKRESQINDAGEALAQDMQACDSRAHRPSSLAAATARAKRLSKAERARIADREEKMHERKEASEFISRLTRTSHAARKELQKARLQTKQEAKAKARKTPTARAFKIWKQLRRRRVAATFHSVLVTVEIRVRDAWKRITAIADTGSGPTLMRLSDTQYRMSELESPDVTLFTADGSPFKDLVGATDVQFRFPGYSKVYDARSQVVDSDGMTPIIGVDFFKRHGAHFNFEEDCITIPGDPDTPGDCDVYLPFSSQGAAYVPSADDDATKRKRAARAERQRAAAVATQHTTATATLDTTASAFAMEDLVIPAATKCPRQCQSRS